MYIKKASITPDKVLAGDSETIEIRLIAGKDFSAKGTRIIFDFPATLGFARPADYDQEDDGYVEILVSNPGVKYKKRVWDMEILDFPTENKTSFKGMAQRIYVLDFIDGQMKEDDEIVLCWGISRNGMSIGAKMGTLVPKPNYQCAVDVRYYTDSNRGLPELGRDFKGYTRPKAGQELSLSLSIKPREYKSMRAIRKGSKVFVQLKDKFHNIVDSQEAERTLEKLGLEGIGHFNDSGIYETDVKEAGDRNIKITPDMQNVFEGKNIYFGDLHTHSSHSNDCIEREKMTMTPHDTFEYGRNTACLDFMAVTDHHQPWDIERNKIGFNPWVKLTEVAKTKTAEGEFLAFPGFEFRGPRGDTAVILKETPDYNTIDDPALSDIRKIWSAIDKDNLLTIPHYHNPGSLDEDEWYCDLAVEPVQEIYSCHGSYEDNGSIERSVPRIKSKRKDRYARYILNKGYRYGLVCNSDGHKGNPGTNGLTAVYSKELTKDSIFKAIKNRHVYGTTNARIKLLFTLNDRLMGSEIERADIYKFHIEAEAEDKIKYLDLICDGEITHRFTPGSEVFIESGNINKITGYMYVKVVQMDNHMAYSSPVFIKS